MGLNGHYAYCPICGSLGHKAKSCPVGALEERKDPFGEAARRAAYLRPRDRQHVASPERAMLISGPHRV
jgi:hypothetical protein